MIERCQENLQMSAMGQYPVNETATRCHDLTRYLDKIHQEAFELHPQDISTDSRHEGYHPIPSLQIPGQGRDDHISPIRYQAIRRHPQGVDSALELTDDVFLVAAVIGEENDFLHGHIPVVGDVEEIPDVIEQPNLALFDGEVFPNHYHPVGLAAVSGTIIELGDLLAFQADVLELSFLDHLLLNIFRTAPFLSLDLVACRPLERLPAGFRQGIGELNE